MQYSILISFLLICNLNITVAQKYDPKTGVTTYQNGTRYVPSSAPQNKSGHDLVLAVEDRVNPASKPGHHLIDHVLTTINCAIFPKKCKEALEAAADSQASVEAASKGFSMGTGSEIEYKDWLDNLEKWKNHPPIFFPNGGYGVPIPGGNIRRWTQEIIRGL